MKPCHVILNLHNYCQAAGVRTVLDFHGVHLTRAPAVHIQGQVLQHRLLHQGNQIPHDVIIPFTRSAK